MKHLSSAIDKASEMCGGQNRLAEKLGTSSGALSEWRTGRRSAPVWGVTVIAEMVGADPATLYYAHALEREKLTKKSHARRAIGLALTIMAGAMLSLVWVENSEANQAVSLGLLTSSRTNISAAILLLSLAWVSNFGGLDERDGRCSMTPC